MTFCSNLESLNKNAISEQWSFLFNDSSTLINCKNKSVGENQIIDEKEEEQYSGFLIFEFTTNLIRKNWPVLMRRGQ